MFASLKELDIVKPFLPPDERGPVVLESLAYERHSNLLKQLETRYTLSLSDSQAIPQGEIEHIHRLVWIFDQSLEHRYRQNYIFPFLYLTEEDHRQLSLAVIKRKEQLAARGMPMTISPAHESWETCDVPAGQSIFFGLGANPPSSIIITRFNPDRKNPNAIYPLRTAVAHTILESESCMPQLSRWNKLPVDQVFFAEQIALAYYTDAVLRDSGFGREARFVKTLGNVAEVIRIWKRFMDKVGERTAQDLFFCACVSIHDKERLEVWRILKECILAVHHDQPGRNPPRSLL